jgi:protein-L-isoaspartate(D-aspartate) O-methyltransferase
VAGVTRDESAIDVRAEARAAFLLRLRARGLRDVNVLRAIETVPRELFAPHLYADLAMRDLALPIPCGQTMPEPFVAARIAESARIEPGHRVLEIGAGSGYVTAILARLCASVVSIERFQTLAIAARERLAAIGVANAAVVWGDGLRVTPDIGQFDRIIVHAVLDQPPPTLLGALAVDGVLLVGRRRQDGAGVAMMRLQRAAAGDWVAEPLFACRLQGLIPGIAASL